MANYIVLNYSQVLANDIYTVTWSIAPNSITQTLSNAITANGEPIVSLNTSYSPTSPTPSFTLPAQTYRIISDMPFSYSFDPTNPALSSTYIQNQVLYFISVFNAQYVSTVNTLIAQADTFTGNYILNVT